MTTLLSDTAPSEHDGTIERESCIWLELGCIPTDMLDWIAERGIIGSTREEVAVHIIQTGLGEILNTKRRRTTLSAGYKTVSRLLEEHDNDPTAQDTTNGPPTIPVELFPVPVGEETLVDLALLTTLALWGRSINDTAERVLCDNLLETVRHAQALVGDE